MDPEKTTPYEFYQFWINTDDRDVLKFIKYFTFISFEEIEALESELKEAPEKRIPHKRLAEEMTKLVHGGEEALQQAKKITEALFSGDLASLNAAEIEQGFKDVPSVAIDNKEIGLVDLLVEAGISSSKRQAREDITNGAIYINGVRNQEVTHQLTETDRIEDKFTIIRHGKKKHFLIRF